MLELSVVSFSNNLLVIIKTLQHTSACLNSLVIRSAELLYVLTAVSLDILLTFDIRAFECCWSIESLKILLLIRHKAAT